MPALTDEAIEAGIAAAAPDAVAELMAALDDLVRVRGARPATPWAPVTGTGTAEDPWSMPYPRYAPEVQRLLSALRGVGAQPVFDWVAWRKSSAVDTVADVQQARTADVARAVTSLVRAERFSDGVLARALESGLLVAAATRIAAAAGRDGHERRTDLPRSST